MSDPREEKSPEKTPDRQSNASSQQPYYKRRLNINQDDDATSIYTLRDELSDYMDTKMHENYAEVYPGAERVEYDFTLERQNVYSTNFKESTSHLIKGCLGAGIMSIHEGYKYGGLWASLGVSFIIGLITPYTMYMLVASAQELYVRLRVPRLTYPDLAEAAVAIGPIKFFRKYSKTFRYTVDICLFVQLCGTCCIYQIMIAQTLKQLLEAVSDTMKSSNLTIRMYILIVLVPLFFICMIRNLKYLAPFSLIADLFIGICVVTTLYYSIAQSTDVSQRPAYKSFQGLIHFCGVFIYSIDGCFITLPIENNMKNPKSFTLVLQVAWTVVILAVTLTGFFGYLGWGEDAQSPVTIHMPLKGVTIMLQFLMCAVLTVTFAVNFWVPFRIIWHYIGRKHKRKRGHWERGYRGLLTLLLTCLSLAYPNLIRIMIFLGNFLLAFVSFIFPAFIDSCVFWKHARGTIRWRCIKNFLIVLFGFALAASVFYT